MEKRRSRREAGSLEAEVLAALWAADRALSPADVQAALLQELAYTTVMTTLARLADKGVVAREREGRGYLYRPIEEEADHVATRMQALLEHTNNRQAIFQRFIDGLSDTDGALLASLLEHHEDR